jgi:hypothetical protein
LKDIDKERIIEDLLFEAASRKTLQAKNKTIALKRYISYAVAAILVLGIIAFSGILNFQDDSDFRQNLVAESYTFPKISKSRSEQINIVDSYIDELNTQKYLIVLDKLDNSNLSEMDSYVKSHLLFKANKFKECKALINAIDWEDEFLESDVNLLLIYIAAQSGEGPLKLKQMLSKLNDSDLYKATELINKIETLE